MADMKLRRLPLLLLLPCAAALIACASGASAGTDDPTIKPGAPFTLAPGQTGRLDGGALTVRFDGVSDDSRCPATVDCVWAGSATVHLTITFGEAAPAARDLYVNGTSAKTVAVSGYKVSLIGLAPERQSTKPLPKDAYRAKLRVDRD
ncbi:MULTISPECIES: hypothetical protein [Actinomadura]|uniref:Lipoprotein n=1 Tax=Actinomadura litoris TaxID=2678616 RepID=A0A7K1KWE6_9ACTN|nr:MULTISPECIES: hypothetical protein [Actinomadura]MBT2211593.1 hypothetical protein [Actinomadura sp. NEAU-AAG7]MUN36514.1 hypothetical protein [Actinomadura litoris]